MSIYLSKCHIPAYLDITMPIVVGVSIVKSTSAIRDLVLRARQTLSYQRDHLNKMSENASPSVESVDVSLREEKTIICPLVIQGACI